MVVPANRERTFPWVDSARLHRAEGEDRPAPGSPVDRPADRRASAAHRSRPLTQIRWVALMQETKVIWGISVRIDNAMPVMSAGLCDHF